MNFSGQSTAPRTDGRVGLAQPRQQRTKLGWKIRRSKGTIEIFLEKQGSELRTHLRSA